VKKALTASQLEHLEEHIPYELLMLRFTLGKLRTEKHPLAWNGMLESFAVHARNLYWFLINKRNHAEDHIAREFAETYTVPNASDMTGPFQRLNQQVMHLESSEKRSALTNSILMMPRRLLIGSKSRCRSFGRRLRPRRSRIGSSLRRSLRRVAFATTN